MIQRLIGVSLGALATYLLLVILNPASGGDPNPDYVTAAVVGAVVSFLWPIVIGWYLVRRAKNKRDDQISAEVDRQLAEKQG